jgi:alpha-beta hydrolase superfamily lysophospholipase
MIGIVSCNGPTSVNGNERATIVFHGGYDSFVEEFYPFLEPLTNYGWTVLGFDGPGQGGALRQG